MGYVRNKYTSWDETNGLLFTHFCSKWTITRTFVRRDIHILQVCRKQFSFIGTDPRFANHILPCTQKAYIMLKLRIPQPGEIYKSFWWWKPLLHGNRIIIYQGDCAFSHQYENGIKRYIYILCIRNLWLKSIPIYGIQKVQNLCLDFIFGKQTLQTTCIARLDIAEWYYIYLSDYFFENIFFFIFYLLYRQLCLFSTIVLHA